jgi:hypothetical protein
LAKLLGKVALVGEAIADALRIAKGFLPVIELPLTRLLVPLVLVELEMPLLALGLVVADYSGSLIDKASALNYSTLYSTSLILSFGTCCRTLIQVFMIVNILLLG